MGIHPEGFSGSAGSDWGNPAANGEQKLQIRAC